MVSEPFLNRRAVARHANLMLACAALGAVVLLLAARRWALLVTLLVGWTAASVLARFAWQTWRKARRGLTRGVSAPGRIVESREGSRVAFEMPAAGTEPWAADAWALALGTVQLVAVSALANVRSYLFLGFVLVMTIGLGLRVANAAADRLRIELSSGTWAVDAFVFGRPIRRTGTGPILPELVADALVLWSQDGRIGVLRGELEPEERDWLAARLTSLCAESEHASKLLPLVSDEPGEPAQGVAERRKNST